MIDIVLGGTVRQMEEIDHDQTWQAALSIDIWLTRPPQRTPFWFESYSVTRQAAKRNPAAIAEAMSRNLETILQQLTTDLMLVLEAVEKPTALGIPALPGGSKSSSYVHCGCSPPRALVSRRSRQFFNNFLEGE